MLPNTQIVVRSWLGEFAFVQKPSQFDLQMVLIEVISVRTQKIAENLKAYEKKKRREYDKNYKLKNAEKQRECERTYRLKNREKYKVLNRTYRLNNIEKIQEANTSLVLAETKAERRIQLLEIDMHRRAHVETNNRLIANGIKVITEILETAMHGKLSSQITLIHDTEQSLANFKNKAKKHGYIVPASAHSRLFQMDTSFLWTKVYAKVHGFKGVINSYTQKD